MDGFRLSPQQDLLSKSALGPDGTNLWSQQLLLEVSGEIDESEIRDAMQRAVESHEIYSTYFSSISGVQVQVVPEVTAKIDWHSEDLRGVDGDQQQQALSDVRESLSSEIPGSSGSIIRAAHLRIADGRAWLLISCAPMIADGTSLLMLALQSVAGTSQRDVGDSTEEEALEYADISEWLNELLSDEGSSEQLDFWAKQLAKWGEASDNQNSVALDEAREFRWVDLALQPETERRIQDLSEQLNVDSSTVMSAVWAALHCRLSENGRAGCGLLSNGRSYEELSDSHGPLERTVPCAVVLADGSTFRDFLGGFQEIESDLLGRQEYFGPTSLLAEQSERGSVHWPNVAAHFDCRPLTRNESVDVKVLDIVAHDAPFATKLATFFDDEQRTARVWYDSSLKSESDAITLGARFTLLLDAVLDNANTVLEGVSLLTPYDVEAINTNLRQGEIEDAGDFDVLAAIRGLGELDPDSPAVTAGNRTWNYSQLSAWSNRISNRLLSLTSTGEPVGICIPRSPELLSAIVGVLNAGMAYVPVDPEYPSERIEQVLSDSGAKVVLVSGAQAPTLPSMDAVVVSVDEGDAEILSCSDELPELDANDDSLAYILYTSGSTGTPKGVEISRRNLRYSTAARKSFYSETPETFLLMSSVAFDSSVAGIFWTLLGGGHLLMLETATGLDAGEIAVACRKHRPTHTLCLPSVYSLMLDEIDSDDLSSLKCVIVAGESCAAGVVKNHFDHDPERRLYNEYGPTEGTVWSVVHQFTQDEDLSAGVPIGKAVPGYDAYVLDEQRGQVPVGQKGELYLGGPGVAPGYWRQESLTSERFLDVNTSESTTQRLYRTGDIVRIRQSGELDFFGRRDNQVKVNGYRIELEEIESVLKTVPDVSDAIALVHSDGDTESRLLAFAKAGPDVEAQLLNSVLGKRLPRYMIPSSMILLDDFPLMPNGKVDRVALLERQDTVAAAAEYVAPRDEVEQLQADIWADLLEKEEIGIADDFFQIGGHSILATRLVARLRDYLQIDIPIRFIFDNPTIDSFTSALRKSDEFVDQIRAVEEALEAETG